MPEAFAQQLEGLWNSEDGYLLGLNEGRLYKELIRRDARPTPLDHKLRCKFWVEFERVQENVPKMAKMSMINILGLDYPKESFYRFYITDHNKLAFLLCPPTDYEDMVEMVLKVSTMKMLEILESPCMFPGGVIDPQVVKKFMEINETMHRRKLMLEYKTMKLPNMRKEEAEPEPEAPPELNTDEEKLAELERLNLELAKLPGQA